jgi:hypothetical protein
MGKVNEGGGSGIFQCAIPVFAWGETDKNNVTSVVHKGFTKHLFISDYWSNFQSRKVKRLKI